MHFWWQQPLLYLYKMYEMPVTHPFSAGTGVPVTVAGKMGAGGLPEGKVHLEGRNELTHPGDLFFNSMPQ